MKIVLTLFAVVLFVSGADAIKCYSCVDCSSPENSIDCGSLFDRCLLVVANGKKSRSCYAKTACDLLPDAAMCDATTTDNCSTCCEGDNCNSAGIAGVSGMTIFIVLLFSLFLMKE